MMANGSDDPADVIAFYRKLESGYDSRFIRGGRVIDYPKFKLALNRVVNLMIRTLFVIRYNDVTNTFKLYRRSAIAGVQPLLSQVAARGQIALRRRCSDGVRTATDASRNTLPVGRWHFRSPLTGVTT
jgi:hypothetical protein